MAHFQIERQIKPRTFRTKTKMPGRSYVCTVRRTNLNPPYHEKKFFEK